MTTQKANTQHTPGPWKRRSNGQIVQWSDTRVATIANVMSGNADARLIAAAPRMLEALRKAFENLDSHIHGGRTIHNEIAWGVEARAILRAIEADVQGEG